MSNELYHYGIKGMKWGVRRFQNEDGSYKAGAEGRYNPDGLPGVHKAKAAMAKVREKFRNKDIHVKQRQEKPPKPQKTPEEIEAEKERRKKILRNVAIGAGVAVGAAVVYKCGKTYVNNIKAQNMALYQQESAVIFSTISNVKMAEIDAWAAPKEKQLKEAEDAFGKELAKREHELNELKERAWSDPDTADKLHEKSMEFSEWKRNAKADLRAKREPFDTEKALRSGDATKQALDAVNAYQAQHKKPMRYAGQDDDFRTAYKHVHDYKKYGTMRGLDQAIASTEKNADMPADFKASKAVENTLLGRGSLRENMRTYVDSIKQQNAELYKKEADIIFNRTAGVKLNEIDKQQIPFGMSDGEKQGIERFKAAKRVEAIDAARKAAESYRNKHDQNRDEDDFITAYRRVRNYRRRGALDLGKELYGG